MTKFNWGHGVAIFFTFFVCMTVYQVIKSASEDHTLVKDDYYIDDTQLQEIMVKKANQHALENFSLNYNNETKTIAISFPEGDTPSGTFKLYCPSNAHMDQSIEIKVNSNNEFNYDTKNLRNGKWKVLLDWKDSKKSYYIEKDFFII